jgi:hypothetical protein
VVLVAIDVGTTNHDGATRLIAEQR